ncbi:MAG: hypothetical protein N2491_00805 [Negativicutes bacterium]|nr:hypothetical protein [Negativicutes bacterium]
MTGNKLQAAERYTNFWFSFSQGCFFSFGFFAFTGKKEYTGSLAKNLGNNHRHRQRLL